MLLRWYSRARGSSSLLIRLYTAPIRVMLHLLPFSPNSPLLCPLWACLCNSLSDKDLVLLAPLEHCHLCPRHADSDLLSSERLYRFRSVETLRAVSNITTPLLTLSSCSKYFPYLKEYVSLAPDRYQGPTCCAFAQLQGDVLFEIWNISSRMTT